MYQINTPQLALIHGGETDSIVEIPMANGQDNEAHLYSDNDITINTAPITIDIHFDFNFYFNTANSDI